MNDVKVKYGSQGNLMSQEVVLVCLQWIYSL